jgi:hypothetical protein
MIKKVIDVKAFKVKNSPNIKLFFLLGLFKKFVLNKNSGGKKYFPNRWVCPGKCPEVIGLKVKITAEIIAA